MIGCFQDTPKKRELTSDTPRHDETILGFLDRFPLYLTSTSSLGGRFQPFFYTVTSRGSHTCQRCCFSCCNQTRNRQSEQWKDASALSSFSNTWTSDHALSSSSYHLFHKGGVMSCGQCSFPPFISFVFAQEELIGAYTPPWDRPAVSHD